MSQPRPDPVQPADDNARSLARKLLSEATHAALAYTDPATAAPGISRIAFGLCPAYQPMTLVSALSAHHAALTTHPEAALMVGEVGDKGDPLTHPRLMLRVRASFIDRKSPDHPALRDHWLLGHPKARLYIDFADFALVRLQPVSALLNGGFGKAFRLEVEDLLPPT
ncbi:pyridoxamine 5-phosphate oxidase [Gemmobacter denitrificans]|uniref:Pyridoxamine 5-phosphate oxidase n=1 Tax=Gemmobacter denitrificans TaxID=3123040 RepID=A0ABU8BVL9_9RHOB